MPPSQDVQDFVGQLMWLGFVGFCALWCIGAGVQLVWQCFRGEDGSDSSKTGTGGR